MGVPVFLVFSGTRKRCLLGEKLDRNKIRSKGVNPCSKVRDDVTDRVRAIIATKEEGKETSRSKKQMIVETKSPGNVPSRKCGPGFRGPPAETLKTSWLERITTRWTIIRDTWTDNKSRALIDFLVSSPSRTFFHKSVDASSYFKNNKCLCDSRFQARECCPNNYGQCSKLHRLARQMKTKSLEADPIQFDDIDMTSEWVEETEHPSPIPWPDHLGGSILDGNDLNIRQFNVVFCDPIFNL
ncbi:protein of unknown function DUF659 [Dillenia turbinata]|uniref:DUF659 domain-containing protein n=1 Tax=Dillenia turbinata TaxID=194707 RepID=A0AAN8ZA11_9MAGN